MTIPASIAAPIAIHTGAEIAASGASIAVIAARSPPNAPVAAVVAPVDTTVASAPRIDEPVSSACVMAAASVATANLSRAKVRAFVA